MVDINLFEDDDEQLGKKEKVGDSSGKKESGLSGDTLKEDDFNFDEDPAGVSLDPFGESEIKPEFSEPESASRQKSGRGGGKTAAVSPVVIVLGLVVLAVVVYLKFFMSSPKSVPQPQRSKPAFQMKPDTTRKGTGASALKAVPFPGGTAGEASIQTVKYIETTKTILENLGRDGQFGVLLLKGDQFFVEYAAANGGLSESIGKKIQNLIGADGFTVSKEERRLINQTAWYFGVISGKLPSMNPPVPKPQRMTADQFVEQVKNLVGQNGLNSSKIQKFSEYMRNMKLQTPVSLRAEGSRKNTMEFLESCKNLQGNFELMTVLVVPLEIADRQANQVKLVVDFAVQ
jgi:hypothetical protein